MVEPGPQGRLGRVEVAGEELCRSASRAGGLDWMDTIELEKYYGEKSRPLAESLEPWSDPHVPERYLPGHLAGFTRSTVR